MGFPFNCPCLCWPSPSHRNQANQPSNHQQPSQLPSAIDADERTPLIVNPPEITPPPHLPLIDTAQQQADEEAVNKIVYQTVRCLVDVYSQAPFSHLKIQGSSQPPHCSKSDLPHTPEGSASTWRAYDPPRCPPVISEVHRLRLGFDQPISNFHSADSTSSNGRDEQNHPSVGQKRSFHSLKTIINHQKHDSSSSQYQANSKPTWSLMDHPSDSISSSCILPPPQSIQSPGRPETLHHSRENSMTLTSCSTQFDTIRTFQTARDDPNLVLELDDNTTPVLSRSITLSPSPSPLLDDGNGQLLNGDHPADPKSHPPPDFVHNLFGQGQPTSTTTTTIGSSLAQQNTSTSSATAETSTPDLDPIARPPGESDDFLTDDPKKLAQLISQGFRLKDPGPILVEL